MPRSDSPPPTDSRGGDWSYDQLYTRSRTTLRPALAGRLGSTHDADDVLHDAFVRIWQHAARYRRELGSGRAWVHSILRYRVLNALRSGTRHIEMDDGFIERVLDDAPQAEAQALERSERRLLRHCLQRLERPRRQPILLAFYRGLTHEQIAQRLSTPLGTIKGRIRAGLRALQECLQA